MLADGVVCHCVAKGTSLEKFSGKFQRYVVLAYHNDVDAFVYPLTSVRSSNRALAVDSKSFLVLDHGLFRVDLKLLTPTDRRFGRLGELAHVVQQHLADHGIRMEKGGNRPLSHQPLRDLERLKKATEPKKITRPAPKPLSDHELFERYMKDEVDEDIDRRGGDGRRKS
ncbi:MAG: hypothetical protein J0L72_11845 [Armatimonadetes bacterium]|nr:hypothetical protein [Armatimonadota bacterium]